MKPKFKLGILVEDMATGFSGVTTGVTYYLDGRIEYCVQPKATPQGEFRDPKWIPECYLAEKKHTREPLGFVTELEEHT